MEVSMSRVPQGFEASKQRLLRKLEAVKKWQVAKKVAKVFEQTILDQSWQVLKRCMIHLGKL